MTNVNHNIVLNFNISKKKYFNSISNTNTNLSSGSCVVVGGGVVMMQEGGVQLAWVSAPVSPITRRMYLEVGTFIQLGW